jgi:Arc/MetJ-type ribon-helix-helix transcriptional regulator
MSIKLPAHLAEKVSRLAREQRTSRSAVIRRAVEALPSEQPKGSFLQAAERFCGIYRGGPRDLSSNRKYLDDFGA